MKKISLSFVGSLFALGITGIFTITGCSPSNINMADENRNANNLDRDYRSFSANSNRSFNIKAGDKEISSESVGDVRNGIAQGMEAFLNSPNASIAVVKNPAARASMRAIVGEQQVEEETEADEAVADGETAEADEEEASEEEETEEGNYFVSYHQATEDALEAVESRRFVVHRDEENDKVTGLTVVYSEDEELNYEFAEDKQLKTGDGDDAYVLVIAKEDMENFNNGNHSSNTITVLQYQSNNKTDNKIEAELRVFDSESLKNVMTDGELTKNSVTATGALESRFLINTGPVLNVSTNCANRGPSGEMICGFEQAEEGDRSAYVTIAQAVWLSSSVNDVIADREDKGDDFNIDSHFGYSGNMDIELDYKLSEEAVDNISGKSVKLSYQSIRQDSSDDGLPLLDGTEINVAQATRDHFRGDITVGGPNFVIQRAGPWSAVTGLLTSQKVATVYRDYNIHLDNWVVSAPPSNEVLLLERQIGGNNLYLKFSFPSADPHRGPVLLTLDRFEDVANRVVPPAPSSPENEDAENASVEGDGTTENGGEDAGATPPAAGEGDQTAEGESNDGGDAATPEDGETSSPEPDGQIVSNFDGDIV